MVIVTLEDEARQEDFIALKEEEREKIMLEAEVVTRHPLRDSSVTKQSSSIHTKCLFDEVMGTCMYVYVLATGLVGPTVSGVY